MVLTKNNLNYMLLFKSQQGRRKWCFAAQFRIYPSTNLHQRFPSLIVSRFRFHSPIECLRNFISLVSCCKNKLYFTCKSVNSVLEFLIDCGSKLVFRQKSAIYWDEIIVFWIKVITNWQKLGMVLGSKVFKKLKLSKKAWW